MKTIYTILFLTVLSVISNAQLLDTFSGHEFEVQRSGKTFNKKATDQVILQNRNNKLGIQNLLDSAGSGAELLWRAKGSLSEIYKQIQGSNISWIWSQASPGNVSLTVTLNPDGSGFIDLYQGQLLVGYIRCNSSAIRNKFGGQPYEGKTKVWKKKSDYTNGDGVEMPNSMFIDKPERKLAIHAGNILTKSGGCVRIGIFASEQLYRLVADGAEVTIVWNRFP